MKQTRTYQQALALVAAIAMTAFGSAQVRAQEPEANASAGGTQVVIGGGTLTPTEAEDLAAYDAAIADYQSGSYAALAPHLPRLRAALDRAPASYPAIEQTGPGRWVVRAGDMGEAILLSTVASTLAQQTEPGVTARVETQANVYPVIALLLGAEATERHAFPEAISYMDRGLALQPGYAFLAGEKMAALQAQGLWAEALEVGDAALEAGGLNSLVGESSGIVHRRRGFSLIELGRIEEAKVAYQISLERQPGNTAALGELEYIEQLLAGGAATAPVALAPPSPASPPDGD